MRVVLDTNVLVSGLLKPYGAPGTIVRMTSAGTLELCHDARTLSEYREVLLRPKFRFPPSDVEALLDQIRSSGHPASPEPLTHRLPDVDDQAFLEVAISGQAHYLITGNLRHYVTWKGGLTRIVAPSDFLKALAD